MFSGFYAVFFNVDCTMRIHVVACRFILLPTTSIMSSKIVYPPDASMPIKDHGSFVFHAPCDADIAGDLTLFQHYFFYIVNSLVHFYVLLLLTSKQVSIMFLIAIGVLCKDVCCQLFSVTKGFSYIAFEQTALVIAFCEKYICMSSLLV